MLTFLPVPDRRGDEFAFGGDDLKNAVHPAAVRSTHPHDDARRVLFPPSK